MPASEPTEPDETPEMEEGAGSEDALPGDELRELEETVDRLLDRVQSLARRAREAEEAHAELRRALSRPGGERAEGDGSLDADERLRELSRENERLRELLDRGRERAERIRQRLVLLEDEA